MINFKTIITNSLAVAFLWSASVYPSQPAAATVSADPASGWNASSMITLMGSVVALGHAGYATYSYLNKSTPAQKTSLLSSLEGTAKQDAESFVLAALSSPAGLSALEQTTIASIERNPLVAKLTPLAAAVEGLVKNHASLSADFQSAKADIGKMASKMDPLAVKVESLVTGHNSLSSDLQWVKNEFKGWSTNGHLPPQLAASLADVKKTVDAGAAAPLLVLGSQSAAKPIQEQSKPAAKKPFCGSCGSNA